MQNNTVILIELSPNGYSSIQRKLFTVKTNIPLTDAEIKQYVKTTMNELSINDYSIEALRKKLHEKNVVELAEEIQPDIVVSDAE